MGALYLRPRPGCCTPSPSLTMTFSAGPAPGQRRFERLGRHPHLPGQKFQRLRQPPGRHQRIQPGQHPAHLIGIQARPRPGTPPTFAPLRFQPAGQCGAPLGHRHRPAQVRGLETQRPGTQGLAVRPAHGLVQQARQTLKLGFADYPAAQLVEKIPKHIGPFGHRCLQARGQQGIVIQRPLQRAHQILGHALLRQIQCRGQLVGRKASLAQAVTVAYDRPATLDRIPPRPGLDRLLDRRQCLVEIGKRPARWTSARRLRPGAGASTDS